MNFYEFAGNHPILTFFLAWIVGNTIIRSLFVVSNSFRKRK